MLSPNFHETVVNDNFDILYRKVNLTISKA